MLLCASQLPDTAPEKQAIINKVVQEWTAYHRYAWDAANSVWISISTDGQALPYKQMQIAGYYSDSE